MLIRTFPRAAHNASASDAAGAVPTDMQVPPGGNAKNLKGSGPSFGSISRGEGGAFLSPFK
jgi:hypothetical protein